MNGQFLMNKAITVQYAFKKDGKGERHGTSAERLLAAQARKNNALPMGARPPPGAMGFNGPYQGQFAGALAAPPPPPPPGFAPQQITPPMGMGMPMGMPPPGMAPPGMAPPGMPPGMAPPGMGPPGMMPPGMMPPPPPPNMPVYGGFAPPPPPGFGGQIPQMGPPIHYQ